MPAQQLPKGLASPGLLAVIVTAKYVMGCRCIASHTGRSAVSGDAGPMERSGHGNAANA